MIGLLSFRAILTDLVQTQAAFGNKGVIHSFLHLPQLFAAEGHFAQIEGDICHDKPR